MKPFHLVLHLDTPVLRTKGYLTLDGLIACAFKECTGRYPSDEESPLRFEEGIAHASAAFFTPGQLGRRTFYRGLTAQDMPGLDDISHPISGKKSWRLEQKKNEWKKLMGQYDSISSKEAHFFGVGDIAKVSALVSPSNGYLPGVGAKARSGFGRIASAQIHPLVEDLSWCVMGQPARPLPEDLWVKTYPQIRPMVITTARCRFPYWEGPAQRCVLPPTLIYTTRSLDAAVEQARGDNTESITV